MSASHNHLQEASFEDLFKRIALCVASNELKLSLPEDLHDFHDMLERFNKNQLSDKECDDLFQLLDPVTKLDFSGITKFLLESHVLSHTNADNDASTDIPEFTVFPYVEEMAEIINQLPRLTSLNIRNNTFGINELALLHTAIGNHPSLNQIQADNERLQQALATSPEILNEETDPDNNLDDEMPDVDDSQYEADVESEAQEESPTPSPVSANSETTPISDKIAQDTVEIRKTKSSGSPHRNLFFTPSTTESSSSNSPTPIPYLSSSSEPPSPRKFQNPTPDTITNDQHDIVKPIARKPPLA